MALVSGSFGWDWCPYNGNLRELPQPFYYVRMQQEMAICESGIRHSPGTESTGDLIWDFPAFRTRKNNILLFINYLVYGVLI
jgi:hypothetical protein